MVNDFGKAPTIVGLHESVFFDKEFIEQVLADLKRKALFVKLEMDEFTAAEKLAYEVLKENGYAS